MLDSENMKISQAEVRRVATLARVELDDDELESVGRDLNRILDYVAKLDELDTSTVEPTAQVVDFAAPMRTDEVTNKPAPEDAVANAPRSDKNFFVVPSIIE